MDDLTELEKQLLMSASVGGLGPTTDLSRANTAKVVNQVLRWRGLNEVEVIAGWRERECDPEHELVYTALVHMTRQLLGDGSFRPAERTGPALFEGGGNWGVPGDLDQSPCWPQYNSCRPTPEGEHLGRLYLAQRPEFRKIAEPGAAADRGNGDGLPGR